MNVDAYEYNKLNEAMIAYVKQKKFPKDHMNVIPPNKELHSQKK